MKPCDAKAFSEAFSLFMGGFPGWFPGKMTHAAYWEKLKRFSLKAVLMALERAGDECDVSRPPTMFELEAAAGKMEQRLKLFNAPRAPEIAADGPGEPTVGPTTPEAAKIAQEVTEALSRSYADQWEQNAAVVRALVAAVGNMGKKS